jgi:hypothetical protein
MHADIQLSQHTPFTMSTSTTVPHVLLLFLVQVFDAASRSPHVYEPRCHGVDFWLHNQLPEVDAVAAGAQAGRVTAQCVGYTLCCDCAKLGAVVNMSSSSVTVACDAGEGGRV